MKLPRPTSDIDRRALKTATARLLDQCGGRESAAVVTRVSHQTLSDYANTGNERHQDSFMPADILLDLARDRSSAGEVSALLQELCRMAGGAFVPLAPKASSGVWAGQVASVVKEGSDAASIVCRSLADDGDVTPEEIRDQKIIEEINEAVEAFLILRAHCELVLEAEQGGGS